MADLPGEEVVTRLPRLKILPRAKPFDKLRLVRLLLREWGDVVAAGAGTNDALALRRADVELTTGWPDRGGERAAGMTLVEGDLRGSRRSGVERCVAARKTTAKNEHGRPIWAGRGRT